MTRKKTCCSIRVSGWRIVGGARMSKVVVVNGVLLELLKSK